LPLGIYVVVYSVFSLEQTEGCLFIGEFMRYFLTIQRIFSSERCFLP
jgi:hypothetical protein